MRCTRIEILAVVLMVLVAVTGVVWTVWYGLEVSHALFVKDWREWDFVDDTVLVTPWMRLSMVPLYLPMLAFGLANTVFALLLLNLFRQSVLFDPRAAKRVICLGVSMVGAMLADTVIWISAVPLYSRWNADGPAALHYAYDSGDIVIGLAGMGFILCGMLMKEAILISRENAGVV